MAGLSFFVDDDESGNLDEKKDLRELDGPETTFVLTCCATGSKMDSMVLVWKTGIVSRTEGTERERNDRSVTPPFSRLIRFRSGSGWSQLATAELIRRDQRHRCHTRAKRQRS